ncbi:MAG: hypothetical protein JO224_01310 [Pelomonas sp.]|nr:hypothetical protein [Roseateles sp.]
MTENPFAKFVPGFDFMQGLVKNAGSALPGFGQWVAPTLDPEALGKRIDELRAVQFWLEQNAKMLGTTVQALEVQRMTLATLKTMNVPLADLGEALKVKPAAPAPSPAAEATKAAAPAAAKTRAKPAGGKTAAPATPADPAAAAVDPLKWWGALSQQFTELASNAMKDVAPVAEQMAAMAGAATAATQPTAKAAPAKTAAARPAARKRKA